MSVKNIFQKVSLNLVLVAILGVLAGVVIKTQALQSITIGFDDGKLVGGQQSYDLEKIVAQAKAKQKEQMKKQEEQMKKMQEEQEKDSQDQDKK